VEPISLDDCPERRAPGSVAWRAHEVLTGSFSALLLQATLECRCVIANVLYHTRLIHPLDIAKREERFAVP